jgi:hypothetical protein
LQFSGKDQNFGGTGFQPVPAQAEACGYIILQEAQTFFIFILKTEN